jgi:hypothetical protein
MTEHRQLLANRIITPDGTTLQSYNRHDYKTYTDKVSGETYMIDGGLDYCRCNINHIPATDACVYADDPHEIIREAFAWGTRGVDGRQPLKFVELKNLTTDHIEAIIETQYQIPDFMRKVFWDELKFRGTSDV